MEKVMRFVESLGYLFGADFELAYTEWVYPEAKKLSSKWGDNLELDDLTIIEIQITATNNALKELEAFGNYENIALAKGYLSFLESRKSELQLVINKPQLTHRLDTDKLTSIYKSLSGGYIKGELKNWLYWFYGVKTNNPKPIIWLKSTPELLYFMQKLCPNDFIKGNRKLAELNIIFKMESGKKVESNQKATTVKDKRKPIDKLFD